MVSSWFRNDSTSSNHHHDPKLPIKELIKVLSPKKSTEERGRFSNLLLDHGERILQDWAVVVYSAPGSLQDGDETTTSRKDIDNTLDNNTNNNNNNKIQWEQQPQTTRKSSRQTSFTTSRFTQKSQPPLDKNAYPSMQMTKIEGRLYLCSRSLVFEPNETSRGLVRCSFAQLVAAPRESTQENTSFETHCSIDWTAKRHNVMKANNSIGPFVTVYCPTHFSCTFLHSTPGVFVELCHELWHSSVQTNQRPTTDATTSGPHSADQSGNINNNVDALLKPMMDRPFDLDNLIHVREQPLTPTLRCQIVTPLSSRPGVLVLTGERVYFQPIVGILQTTTTSRAIHWTHKSIVVTARRYHGLRDCALELYLPDMSILFAFERRHDRESVMHYLPVHVPCLTDREFVVQVAIEWQTGAISNYDYLLALNAAAGRSFHDLSRYPVFPWIIADYSSPKLDLTKKETFRDLSKPIGALNEERLAYFKTRLESMQDMGEPFLYGTHYSAPGYVLYFLVRSMPEHMLCLQNGKFDAPDRMFHSVANCYQCVLSNHADVKELIPEFYNPLHDFDFLINARGLQLGATQTGDRVDDVQLPPWARSARDFIKKNRKALECELVTAMLPRWLDLIFGHLSRGEAALQANNLFHQMAYLGPTDLANMQTEEERVRAELQATEFGIVPDMLFRAAHPAREDAVSDDFISPDLGRASSKDDSTSGREAWELLDVPSSATPDDNNKLPLRGVGDATKPKDSHKASRPPPVASLTPQYSSSSPPQTLPTPPSDRSGQSLTPSDWDMKILERSRFHSDAVSACVLLFDSTNDTSLLATTSLDGGLMVHTVSLELMEQDVAKGVAAFGSSLRFSYSAILSRTTSQGSATALAQSKLTEYRTHSTRDPLASLAVAHDGSGGHVAFAGGHDDVVLAYGITSACAVASVYSHRDAVTGLDLISRTFSDAECALWRENSTHIMISGSWDATVKVWSATVAAGETVSISREPLSELFDADSSIVCVSALKAHTGDGGIVIAAGCADGSFCVWNVHNDGVQVVIHKEPAKRGSGPCSDVQWVYESNALHLFAAFSTGKIATYGLKNGKLKRDAAVSVGVAVLSMVYAKGMLLVGCSDGGLRLIPVRNAVAFDSKPTLWKAVNNKSAPGISSIGVAYATGRDGENRCICSTGGEDGSIAIVELKEASKQQQSGGLF